MMCDKLHKIVRKTMDLFSKYGIRSVSMDDICLSMQMSKKTLYKYVNNKSDLIEKILEFHFGSHTYLQTIMKKKNLNAIDVLFEVSRVTSKNIKALNLSLIHDLKKYYSDVYNKYFSLRRNIILEEIKNNIRKGIDDGLYRSDLNIDLIAQLYIKRLMDIHEGEFLKSKRFSFSTVFEVIFENHIRGISNEKGIAYLEKKKGTYTL